jgi:hypothetical protein
MRKFQRKTLLFLAAATTIITACRKADQPVSVNNTFLADTTITQQFFSIPVAADPVVQAIAKEIERRNGSKEFITEFAKNKGFAVWDKAILSFPKAKAGSNFGNTAADSLVYIPLVLQNTAVTNGFIRAVINDSISLSYCLAKDYKNYPFTTTTGATTADEFSSLLMLMDREVFGYNMFTITDNRLLNEPGSTNVSPYTRTAKILSATNGINAGNNLCEGTIYTVSWLVQDAANCTCANGASNGGVCQDWQAGCTACSNTVTITITVGGGSCGGGGPVGGGTPTTGGPSGGGTGSGGGQIPPYYPCSGGIPTSLLPEPLPPCPPPGGGGGWVPGGGTNSPSANQNIIDSLQGYPCAQRILRQLPSINDTAKSILQRVFGVNDKVNIIFRADSTILAPNQSGGTSGTGISSNGTFKAIVLININVLKNSSKEFIAKTMFHEAIHAYLKYQWKKYTNGLIDSTTFKLMFPKIWEYQTNQPLAHHIEMAESYVDDIKSIVRGFNPLLADSINKAIAWSGLWETQAWKNLGIDTNRLNRLRIIARGDTTIAATNAMQAIGLHKCN